jgi:hypothetical protein
MWFSQTLGLQASGSAGDLGEALIERGQPDRAEPEAKLPSTFWHGPELFTSPGWVAAKLCASAAAEDGLGEAFDRRLRITVETVSGQPHLSRIILNAETDGLSHP